MSRRSQNVSKFNNLYISIENDKKCVYCGEPAAVKDHFTPISYTAVAANSVKLKWDLVLLPACAECNLIAGARTFLTVKEKREYIQERLRINYAKVLKIKRHTEQELAEYGPSMQTFIKEGLWLQVIIRRRLAWQNEKKLESVRCAILSSQRPESRGSFVIQDASSNGTIGRELNLSNMLKDFGLERNKPNLFFLRSVIEEFGLKGAETVLKQIPRPRTW